VTARTPSSWELAVGRIRETCNWLIATMGAIAAAAVGSGAFLSFQNADSLMRIGWLVWGLSMTVAGALIVMWRATLVKLPVSGSIGALVAPVDPQFKKIASRLDQDLTKRHIPTISQEIQAQKDFDDAYDARRQEIVALTGAETPADKRQLALATAWLEYYRARLTESGANIRATLHRAMYLSHRKRFREAPPWIFVGALMVAVGFPTYFAAARLETTVSDEGKETAPAEAEKTATPTDLGTPVQGSVTFTADRFKNLVTRCTDQPRVLALVLGGNGAEDTPWRLRILPNAACPSAFDLAVTRDEAQVSLDVVDPVLTAFLTPPVPPAAVEPERNPWTAFVDARIDQQVSIVVWGATAVGYLMLVVVVARERDDEI
jgi:hypothetical protein